ncbi:hypothetical protein [Sinanaerobacter chloroacetimidivorans]|uniref:Uncharacterized protein n=1 Tax=Sinanaerobacter chloroacetimidivorans TaxID=2818044 RepID=A0A8J7VYK9_9FIRM|nr:hypothetical protein [Sinanaerobacter chloroacetimidivorans]MBR0597477.1 hypothetical protein [Sinanaerobacter chloroacetimidivorans]
MSGKCQEISEYLTYGQMNLINDFRYNVLQLAMWTRAYINAVASGFGSVEGNTKKLHTVPVLFYNSLRPYMGDIIAEEFQNLMFQNILLFTKIVDALNSGDNEAVDRNLSELYQKVEEMANFLAERNLYWDREQWSYLISRYIGMLIDEAVAIFSGDYERGIDIYDRLQYHALVMADYMSRGVISSINARG